MDPQLDVSGNLVLPLSGFNKCNPCASEDGSARSDATSSLQVHLARTNSGRRCPCRWCDSRSRSKSSLSLGSSSRHRGGSQRPTPRAMTRSDSGSQILAIATALADLEYQRWHTALGDTPEIISENSSNPDDRSFVDCHPESTADELDKSKRSTAHSEEDPETEERRRKTAVAAFLLANGFTGGASGPKKGFINTTYPLHRAAKRGNANIVKYLLQEGANPSQKNSAGRTPAQVARKHDRNGSHAAVLRVLAKAWSE
mmetsp:Transcript_46479/g.99525  ORF Transcript_46479/g.99525 Transcript_46479/m.99525 type:complete len:257 (-) Transcript_46479:372-1142(-)